MLLFHDIILFFVDARDCYTFIVIIPYHHNVSGIGFGVYLVISTYLKMQSECEIEINYIAVCLVFTTLSKTGGDLLTFFICRHTIAKVPHQKLVQ